VLDSLRCISRLQEPEDLNELKKHLSASETSKMALLAVQIQKTIHMIFFFFSCMSDIFWHLYLYYSGKVPKDGGRRLPDGPRPTCQKLLLPGSWRPLVGQFRSSSPDLFPPAQSPQ
jgi:hypothetical protein